MKKNVDNKKPTHSMLSYSKLIILGVLLLAFGAGILALWTSYVWSSVFPGEGVEGIRETSILQEQPLRPVRPAEFTEPFQFGEKSLRVFVADTEKTRSRGLSGSAHLPKGAGMLFIFDKEDRHGFWMKDMNYAIDIVWLDEFDKVVHLEKNVDPSSYPRVFYPKSLARKVLELPAGTL